MNKIIFSLCAVSSFMLAQSNDSIDTNPYNTLITAIARNDYGTVVKTLETYSLTPKEKEELLEMADQMIVCAIAWNTQHHNHGEIGKDTFKALGYYFATLVTGAATAISLGAIASTVEAYVKPEHRSRLDILPPVEVSATVAIIFAGLTTYFGYKTVQKFIASWMKPSQRLENSLRIKDAIAHLQAVTLKNNLSGGNCTAVGCNSLSYNFPQEPDDSSYMLIGTYSSALCKAPCCCPSETNFSCRCEGHICCDELDAE